MEKEKRICPNCGKELTLSARKCKYCDTSLIPKLEICRKNIINTLILLISVLIVLSLLFIFILIGKKILFSIGTPIVAIISWFANDGLNDWFFGTIMPWFINSGVGTVILAIILGIIFITLISLTVREFIKELPEILESSTKIMREYREAHEKEMQERNISQVVQKDSLFYVYDEKGRILHTKSHPFGRLLGYTSNSYSIKGRDGWTHVYDKNGRCISEY